MNNSDVVAETFASINRRAKESLWGLQNEIERMPTMHNIMMIPIDALEHHPDNPRKDLGDLKELIASIKESGVMQNLTVVPKPNDEETWWVVIGNRRMEASKAAGLKELPCIISDMDHKTQVATMMAENMQRVDLTLTEQAGGVQMMMDLGMDAKEISKRTGIRKDAVERRALMAKYNAAKVAEAVVRGGTIRDFMELEKLPEEHREAMLEHVGKSDLQQRIRTKLDEIRNKEYMAQVITWLETFATEIEKHGYVGAKVVNMSYVTSWYRFTKQVVESLKMPDDVRNRHYYYIVDRVYGSIKLLAESEASEADEKEALRQRKNAYINQRITQAEALDAKFRQMRYEYLFSGADIVWNEKAILRAYTLVMAQGYWHSSYPDKVQEMTEQLCGLKFKGSGYASRPELADLLAMPEHKLCQVASGLIWGAVDRDGYRPWVKEWNEACLQHKHSAAYQVIYDMLTGMGYQPSDEEAEYLDGTHEVYRTYEEQEVTHGNHTHND